MDESRIARVSIDHLLGYQESALYHACAKLTHVGEQTRPVSSIFMNVYYHLPELDAFKVLRTPGISYVNDELPTILNFSITPGEFRSMVKAVNDIGTSGEETPSLSVAVIVFLSERAEGVELLFTREGGIAVHKALGGALDPTNGIGSAVLNLQRAAAYAEGVTNE